MPTNCSWGYCHCRVRQEVARRIYLTRLQGLKCYMTVRAEYTVHEGRYLRMRVLAWTDSLCGTYQILTRDILVECSSIPIRNTQGWILVLWSFIPMSRWPPARWATDEFTASGITYYLPYFLAFPCFTLRLFSRFVYKLRGSVLRNDG